MISPDEALAVHRRRFLTGAASGLGSLALLSHLRDDGVVEAAPSDAAGPLTPKLPHLPPKATNCIFIFLAGGTSQVELFDPKPKLDELNGQPLPASFFARERFFSIKPDRSLVMQSGFGFRRYGQCGMEMSELLPNIGASADDIALV